MIEDFTINDLYSISGKPGLYKLKSKIGLRVVFERLINPTDKVVVDARNNIVMEFKTVVVYTKTGSVKLEKVFDMLYDMDQISVSDFQEMSPDEKADLMEKCVPDYDKEKFKFFHMEKILKWIAEIQTALDIIDKQEETNSNNATIGSSEVV